MMKLPAEHGNISDFYSYRTLRAGVEYAYKYQPERILNLKGCKV